MDHYTTLQVHRNADPEVIDKAYRALCMKHHPDRAPEHLRKKATHTMQRINAAHAILSDAEARRRYDRTLVDPPAAQSWDRFMQVGLVGLFMDRFESGKR